MRHVQTSCRDCGGFAEHCGGVRDIHGSDFGNGLDQRRLPILGRPVANLRLGDSAVDLRFRRSRDDVGLTVLRREGVVETVVIR